MPITLSAKLTHYQILRKKHLAQAWTHSFVNSILSLVIVTDVSTAATASKEKPTGRILKAARSHLDAHSLDLPWLLHWFCFYSLLWRVSTFLPFDPLLPGKFNRAAVLHPVEVYSLWLNLHIYFSVTFLNLSQGDDIFWAIKLCNI